MNLSLFSYVGSLLFVVLAVVGTTVVGSSNTTNSVWAEVFEGTEGLDFIEGTPAADIIDSNFGDAVPAFGGTGSGSDVIISGGGDDTNTGNEGHDIFACGEGEEDTVTDFNEEEGDIATPDCENI